MLCLLWEKHDYDVIVHRNMPSARQASLSVLHGGMPQTTTVPGYRLALAYVLRAEHLPSVPALAHSFFVLLNATALATLPLCAFSVSSMVPSSKSHA